MIELDYIIIITFHAAYLLRIERRKAYIPEIPCCN